VKKRDSHGSRCAAGGRADPDLLNKMGSTGGHEFGKRSSRGTEHSEAIWTLSQRFSRKMIPGEITVLESLPVPGKI